MFLHLEQIWIPGRHKGRTTLNGRGNVFVVIGILTQPMESKLARDEIAENDNRLEPRHRIDIRANVFSHLGVPERPDNFFDDDQERREAPFISPCAWGSARGDAPTSEPRVPGRPTALR